jgi:hypothetical protein
MEKSVADAQAQPVPPTPHDAEPRHDGPPGNDTTSQPDSGGKKHEFNEQTNYVPVRTIITVLSLGPRTMVGSTWTNQL